MQFLALHPENPHYFLFRGKPTVLVTSGEHYGAVLNLDFDYVKYLETLQKDGLNNTRIWSGAFREIAGSWDIEGNTLAPVARRFVCPWARSEVTGYSEGGAKFDLKRWDEAYFERLRDFVGEASKRGVVVEMNLFCPFYEREDLWKASPMNAGNNIQGIGACDGNSVYALKVPELTQVQEAMTRKVVQELAEYDNVYFEVCNEPYFAGVTQAWQDHIADVIMEAERGLERKHLISMNVANGSAKVEKPHAGVSIFNFHYCTPPVVVGENYGLNKVIGENETGFRGNQDETYRSEAWDFLLAGGALYNNLDYSFTAGHPDGTAILTAPGGGSVALRKQLGVLKKFMDGFAFLKMKPMDEVIKGGVPEGCTAQVLGEAGRQYGVYLKRAVLGTPGVGDWKLRPRVEITDTVRAELAMELPAGSYRAEWISPLDGKVVGSERVEGGVVVLKSPEFGADVALAVRGE